VPAGSVIEWSQIRIRRHIEAQGQPMFGTVMLSGVATELSSSWSRCPDLLGWGGLDGTTVKRCIGMGGELLDGGMHTEEDAQQNQTELAST
jgi:hypothetical protein